MSSASSATGRDARWLVRRSLALPSPPARSGSSTKRPRGRGGPPTTRSLATGEVLRLMVDEFWRLQRERVGERELADAKAYLTGSFPLTIETPDSLALQILTAMV